MPEEIPVANTNRKHIIPRIILATTGMTTAAISLYLLLKKIENKKADGVIYLNYNNAVQPYYNDNWWVDFLNCTSRCSTFQQQTGINCIGWQGGYNLELNQQIIFQIAYAFAQIDLNSDQNPASLANWIIQNFNNLCSTVQNKTELCENSFVSTVFSNSTLDYLNNTVAEFFEFSCTPNDVQSSFPLMKTATAIAAFLSVGLALFALAWKLMNDYFARKTESNLNSHSARFNYGGTGQEKLIDNAATVENKL